jgi:NAD(P)-dependent dehydrogenase (short-subunit alcohol dehydrogenase family)
LEEAVGEFEGKVAVITGAGSGMPEASARVFVREGARASEAGARLQGPNCEVSQTGTTRDIPVVVPTSR